ARQSQGHRPPRREPDRRSAVRSRLAMRHSGRRGITSSTQEDPPATGGFFPFYWLLRYSEITPLARRQREAEARVGAQRRLRGSRSGRRERSALRLGDKF